MRRTALHGLRTGAVALLFALSAKTAWAQSTITGKVTDAQGRPVGGANVLLGGLPNGGATNASGVYTIVVAAQSAKGQAVTMTARFLGKKPATKSINLTAGTQTVDFQLADDPLRLDELVVTGVSEATSTKKLAFAVGKVSADQLQETPGVTALGALQGKVSGVRLVETTGSPGDAPAIRLRGATSISGSQEPLVIIDGTITRLTLADIASEDIERVEVVKGAAASSLYGSDAANGVIQIFTKRGANLADGKLLVTTRNEGGASFMTKRIPNANAHAYKVIACDSFPSGVCFARSNGNRINEPDGIADNPYPQYFDHQAEVVQPGTFLTNYASVGQRKGQTNFNASFQNSKTEGVIFGVKGYQRQNFRINVDQQLTPRVDLSFSSFYGKSNNNDAAQGPGAPFFALTFVEPNIDLFARCPANQIPCGTAGNPDGSPYRALIPDKVSNASNPLYNLFNESRNNDRSRFTGSGRMRWRVQDWLTAEGNYNFDQDRDDFSDIIPFGFLNSAGQPTDGNLYRRNRTGRTYNTGATLTAIRSFWGITNTTKVSYIYEDEARTELIAQGSKLVVKQVPEFAAVDPSTLNATSTETSIRNRNAFAVTTFDIKDRYILDGLIRQDQSSLFGPDARKSTYFRVSGAWRANEDLKIGGIDELRFRGSYGTAGLRPGFEYQYETLAVGAGSFTKQTLGNRNLRPAKSSELEVGTNLELAGGRVTLEYTYSKKKTKDQIIQVNLPSVVGFLTQWQNVGTLEANTHEVALGLQVINNRNMALQLNITGDRTRQKITEWPLPLQLYGPVQTFYINKGASLGVMYGNRVVRTMAELKENPKFSNAADADYVVNEEGYLVSAASYHTPGEKPIMYVNSAGESIVKIGDANPDFNLSFNPVFSWKKLAINGLVDWSQGGQIYNGTRQWPFFENRDRIYDQSGKPEAAKKSQGYYNFFYNSLNPIDFFVEPGTYLKIRELAVHYTLDRKQLKSVGLGKLENVRLGVVGRNLFTFTKYSGYDPEVASPFDNDPFQVRIDWFTYPHFRTFTGLVEIAF